MCLAPLSPITRNPLALVKLRVQPEEQTMDLDHGKWQSTMELISGRLIYAVELHHPNQLLKKFHGDTLLLPIMVSLSNLRFSSDDDPDEVPNFSFHSQVVRGERRMKVIVRTSGTESHRRAQVISHHQFPVPGSRMMWVAEVSSGWVGSARSLNKSNNPSSQIVSLPTTPSGQPRRLIP